MLLGLLLFHTREVENVRCVTSIITGTATLSFLGLAKIIVPISCFGFRFDFVLYYKQSGSCALRATVPYDPYRSKVNLFLFLFLQIQEKVCLIFRNSLIN